MLTDRLFAVLGSVVVHLILVGILAFTMWERPKPAAVAVNKPIIQARAVDEATAMAPVRRREAEEQRKKEAAEQKRRAAEAEKRRQVEVKRKEIAAEKLRQADAKRKKLEAQKQQAELKKKQQEAEQARLAEERRKKQEKKLKDEGERKQKEAEKQRREAELKRQMDAEAKAEAERLAAETRAQRQQQLSQQQLQYISDIANKVQRNWLRAPGSTGTLCSVLINQIPGGDIVGVRVTDCDGDTAFQRSVESAVRKASPLPMPADPALFQREIQFDFKP